MNAGDRAAQKHAVRVRSAVQDPIEMGRKNGLVIVVRRNRKQVKEESAVQIESAVENMVKQIEGEAYGGSTYALQNFDLFCQKHGANADDFIPPQRVEELQAIAVRMAKRIKDLETLAIGIEAAKIEALTMHNPAPIKAILAKFQVTEEEQKSKKVRTILAKAEQALEGFTL
jgi:hypothetical protein